MTALNLEMILRKANTIAVMGCSDQPWRTSHHIADYLQQAGYRIIPVNPHYSTVLGERCYADLQQIPYDIEIDIVDIFRAPQHTEAMVRQAVERSARTGRTPTIWTQLGVSSRAAKALARQARLPYVADRCIMVVHQQVVQ